ncbi:hypothetical protein SNEBB_004297 [Seison nebaliae]|nr:hypothetical protein SNEBB_004297 [Seison nebaliae]
MEIDESNKILCCQCGIEIEANNLNLCLSCLRPSLNICEGIESSYVIQRCQKCFRYHQPPSAWISAEEGSKELLVICMKKIKNINTMRISNASFIWTEPHSKRLKIKLSVQKEVGEGTAIEQSAEIEYIIQNLMCSQCHRAEAKDYWKCCLQLRQKVTHKKTFFYVEQLLVKRDELKDSILFMKQVTGGIDFFFAQQQDAVRLLNFLQASVPIKYETSKQLISHDIRNNTYNYKYNYSVEIVPISKNDIVCLSSKMARALDIGQLCICVRVTKQIHLIDPTTLKKIEVDANRYWRQPFQTICTMKQLQTFMIIHLEELPKQNVFGKELSTGKLIGAWIRPLNDMDCNGNEFFTKTHLGNILKLGDIVLGFDLSLANINNPDYKSSNNSNDIILVKKSYGDSMSRNRRRKWRLKHLEFDRATVKSTDDDMINFMEDLEEDAILREKINIYTKDNVESMNDEEDDNDPVIPLTEMLSNL